MHLGDEGLGRRPADLLHRTKKRPRDDARRGGEDEPDRGPDPRARHHEHLGGAEPPPERTGMHRARPPEGDDAELARVLPVHHRVEARGPRHLLDDDVVDCHRRVLDRMSRLLAELKGRGQALLDEVEAGGCREVVRQVDMRYRNQLYEVPVTLPPSRDLVRGGLPAVEGAFHRAYEERYGRTIRGVPAETVT